jgi:histidine ammonia-lyase
VVEDTLSTGPVAARALGEVAEHAARLAALELIVAAQAVDLRGCAQALGPVMADCHARVRALSPPLEEDRPLSDDLDRVTQAVLADDFA